MLAHIYIEDDSKVILQREQPQPELFWLGLFVLKMGFWITLILFHYFPKENTIQAFSLFSIDKIRSSQPALREFKLLHSSACR